MPEHQRLSLRLVTGPGLTALISAPPILNASDHTIDFTCADCGTVLMHAEEGQVHNVTICCNSCGSYNSTDTLIATLERLPGPSTASPWRVRR